MSAAAEKSSETRPPFAALVRRAMRDRGLGLRELCRAAELDPSFFSKVLSGKRNPPWDEAALRRVAAALGLDAPALIAAAGRIPSEWRRLWEDPSLFAAVHRLASGTSAPSLYSSRHVAPTPTLPHRGGGEMGEELL